MHHHLLSFFQNRVRSKLSNKCLLNGGSVFDLFAVFVRIAFELVLKHEAS